VHASILQYDIVVDVVVVVVVVVVVAGECAA